jgi:hypothetical protein
MLGSSVPGFHNSPVDDIFVIGRLNEVSHVPFLIGQLRDAPRGQRYFEDVHDRFDLNFTKALSSDGNRIISQFRKRMMIEVADLSVEYGLICIAAGFRTQDPFHLGSIGPDSSSPAALISSLYILICISTVVLTLCCAGAT